MIYKTISAILVGICLSSCASDHVILFENKYQSKDYAGALEVGKHILSEEGTLRAIRVLLDNDARRNKNDLLQKMQECTRQLELQKQNAGG